jgi:hypothetical protein
MKSVDYLDPASDWRDNVNCTDKIDNLLNGIYHRVADKRFSSEFKVTSRKNFLGEQHSEGKILNFMERIELLYEKKCRQENKAQDSRNQVGIVDHPPEIATRDEEKDEIEIQKTKPKRSSIDEDYEMTTTGKRKRRLGGSLNEEPQLVRRR